MADNHVEEKSCTVVLHDDRVSQVDILAGQRIMHVGEVAWLSAAGAKTLCICPSGLATNSHEISVHISLAQRFGFENRVPGRVQLIDDVDGATATHAEMVFRDQYLSRADMWQLMGRLQNTVLYRGQVLNYLGTPTAEVKHIYISGVEVESGYSTYPFTKPIFRSGSARYTILVEISQEMLSNWSNGEIMYERLVNGFLPELFGRWNALKVKHQVSVVLFGRSYLANAGAKNESHTAGEDFFHVLVSETVSSSWAIILRKLKQAFNDRTLSRSVSLAAESNMLEAIHLTALDFSDDQSDTHLMSTGTSIIAVTAGTGLFDADHTVLKQTTDLLVGNSIGVDIVALSPKPLHPVPLFKYDHNGTTEYALPHWVDISFWKGPYDSSSSTWTLPRTEEPVNDIAIPFLKDSGRSTTDISRMDAQDAQTFRNEGPSSKDTLRPMLALQEDAVVGSVETMRGVTSAQNATRKAAPIDIVPADQSANKNTSAASKEPLNRAKRQPLPPHPLMMSGRKISVGPKGFAISRGVASTAVSSAHAQDEKELTQGSAHTHNDTSSVAKAIRASLARKSSQISLASHRISEPEQHSVHTSHITNTSKPIDIQPSHSSDDLASIVEQEIAGTMVGGALDNDTSVSTTPKARGEMYNRQKRGSLNESLDMLSPWVMLLNPCNPRKDNMRVASQYRKWQHVFPRAVSSGSFKWASMCSPAALPLTAEYKPSAAELNTHYRTKVRRHIISNSTGLRDETAKNLIERLIDIRLIRGFQIVAIRNSGSDATFQSNDRPILMALGRRYHELQRFSDFEVQIVQYEPNAGIGSEQNGRKHYTTSYEPKMRMLTGITLKSEVTYHSEPPISDWTALDEHILGLAPLPDFRATFQVRLVLIPVDITRSDNNTQSRLGGLSDEERRIEGIQRLTQTWQRQRYFSAADQQHQISLTKAKQVAGPQRDPNPLAIEYQTRDPSVVVNAHGPVLSTQLEEGEVTTPLFAESDKHHSSNFDVAKLARQMQEPPPYGVEMRDRRWLTLTHFKCFRGDEMTTWLLGVFKDLELREDAVALGNELMNRGIFNHVRQKHKFRDGHYFYQISGAHRTTEYPDTQSVFSKVSWRSAPQTSMSDSISSPQSRPVSGISSMSVISGEYAGSTSSRGTPVSGPVDPKEILLSQVMQYNVDPQKKSDHLQVIDLHYGM